MPTAATMAPGASPRARSGDRPVMPTVPFIRASAEHREAAGIDVSRVLTGATQDLGVFDVPAYGYVRNIVLLVTATGGVAGATAPTPAEDGPFSVLRNIALTEPNGAVISQFNTGYSCFLANKWGGYRDPLGADPRATPVFSNVSAATGNFQFLTRIPVEINLRDALGALPNQNAAATFKVRLTLGAAADVYGVAPATLPTVRVRAYLEAWDQPETSAAGQTNQITPPAMNTTQFWTEQSFNVGAGSQNIRLTRVGNYIRNLIMVYRRNGGTRAQGHTDMADPTTIFLDTRPLDFMERNNWLNQMFERTGYGRSLGGTTPALDAPGGLDAGVFVYDFAHEFDGALGRENRDLWLPTLGSTRLEVQGSFANAGVLTVLTNDVAIAGSVFI
jgi:hypothetical protein